MTVDVDGFQGADAQVFNVQFPRHVIHFLYVTLLSITFARDPEQYVLLAKLFLEKLLQNRSNLVVNNASNGSVLIYKYLPKMYANQQGLVVNG